MIEAIKVLGGTAKDIGATVKDVLFGLAVFGVAGWLVWGSKPNEWARIELSKDGIALQHIVKEAKETAADAAKDLEQVRSDLIALKTRIDSGNAVLKVFVGSRSESDLKRLEDILSGAKGVAERSASNAAESSRDTAKAMTKVEKLSNRLEQSATGQPDAASPAGWYYLGKLSKDHRTWLPSSASGALIFLPQPQVGTDQIEQLQRGQVEIHSMGYKYLRSEDSTPGNRVNGKIVRTLEPNTAVKIMRLDATGVDPADGETVVWALVQPVKAR